MNINRTLLDRFTIQGFWTIDGTHKAQGLLECIQGKATLTLIEPLLKETDDFFSISRENIPRVWGFMQTGEQVLLMNCTYAKGVSHIPGCTEYKCRAESMLMSIGYSKQIESHCDLRTSLSEIEIRNIEFQLSWLHVWIGRKAIVSSSHPNEIKSISLNLADYNTETFAFGDFFIITTEKRVQQKYGSDLFAQIITLNEIDVICIEKREGNLVLPDALNVIKKISTLIELLVDESMPFVSVNFKLPISQHVVNETSYIEARYFMPQISTNCVKPHVNCITLNKLKDRFQGVLNEWYANYDKLLLVVNDYLGVKRMERYLETSLLLSIRSLEILGRDFLFTNTKTDQDCIEVAKRTKQLNLRPNLKALLSSLPTTYQKKYIEPLVINTLGSELTIDKFVDRLADTRNFFAHNDSSKPYTKRFTDIRELSEVTISLRCFIKYFLFRILTIPEILIDENLLSIFHI